MSAALAEGVLAVVKAATEPLFARLQALEAEIRAIKASEPVPGPAGPVGPTGRDGVDGKDGAPGVDGRAGVDGKDGAPGRDGGDGKDGRDGVGLASAVISRDGELIVTLTDGSTKALGLVVGAAGRDGVDGKDGLGFDDLTATYDGERTVTLTWSRGDQVKTFPFTLPVVLYRGVFVEGAAYEPGDAVTWGGSLWIAKDRTAVKPGSGPEAKGWQQAVKRGSEGPRGPKGELGPPGPQGPQGRAGVDLR